MTTRTVRLLHVEDDLFEQRLVAQMLTGLPEFTFAVTCVDSEDAAVAEFEKGAEFVLLDYQLSQGNGLSCLQKLRTRDRITPIVAMSGTATPEIAAELVAEGADDYIGKQDLTPELLARAVRDALTRADAWRRHSPGRDAAADRVTQMFVELSRDFVAALGPDLLARLDAFEALARSSRVGLDRVQALFDAGAAAHGQPRGLQRPLELELLLRLADDLSGFEQGSAGNS
jgi:CheY-like chemotaxis protein